MEQLYELYYNPKTGFLSAQKLYLKLNKLVPMKTIQDFLQKQQVQKSREAVRKWCFGHTSAESNHPKREN